MSEKRGPKKGKKRKRRGMMVKKIMKEKNLKFMEASKHVKQNDTKC